MFRISFIYWTKAMKTTHTPGPWHLMEGGFSVSGPHPDLIQVYATGEDLEMICKVWRDSHLIHRKQDFKANARLIAAAPQLLEALNGLLMCPDLNLDTLETETVEAIQHAQQVINKATNGNG